MTNLGYVINQLYQISIIVSKLHLQALPISLYYLRLCMNNISLTSLTGP